MESEDMQNIKNIVKQYIQDFIGNGIYDLIKLFREQSVSGRRKKQITFLLHLPIPLDCTPVFTN